MTVFSNLGNKKTGNYVEINDTSGLTLKGDCIVWEDLRFPATAEEYTK